MAHHYSNRSADPAQKIPEGAPAVKRGPEADPPKMAFRGTSWKWYHRRKWKSFKLPKKSHAEAQRRFDIIKAKIQAAEEVRERPGDMLFKTMIKQRLAFLAATAVTPKKLTDLAQAGSDSVWWLRYFANRKLKSYRAKDSELYQAWYVKQRKEFYRTHPHSRKQAANGAVQSLRHLKKFLKDFAEDEETGWFPNIKIPKTVEVSAGRILERWEQARMLHACRGRVWDRDNNCWKTKTYTDDRGIERITFRIRPKRIIIGRKAYSRVIRAGIITAIREEVFSEAVWGRHKFLAHFDVDDEGNGDFRRRGTSKPENNKTRPTSPVTDRLKKWLRIWMYEDGQTFRIIGSGKDKKKHVRGKKFNYVFRKVDDFPYEQIDLRGVVHDAGLNPDVTEHALRYTAVDEAHKQRLSLKDAAEILGMGQEMLLKRYTDWSRMVGRSRQQTLEAANSKTAARLLRNASRGNSKAARKRNYDRRAAQLARKAAKSSE